MTGHKIVDEISQLSFRGNIVPASWYQKITFGSKGKADLIAITLLSDIVYWYRWSEVRKEGSGKLVGYKKKFKADMLQRSYSAFAKQFGISKRQAQDAVDRLVAGGFVRKAIRHIPTKTGLTISNVIFLEPVVARIKETYTEAEEATLRSNVGCPTPEGTTYTETSPETTTSFSPSEGSASPSGEGKKKQANPNFTPLKDRWVSLYEFQYGCNPVFDGRRARVLSDLLQQVKNDLEKAKGVLEAFLADDSDFLTSHNHDLIFLNSNLSKYLVAQQPLVYTYESPTNTFIET